MLELIDCLPSKLLRHQVLSLAPATTNPPCGHSTVNRMGASCDYKFHDVWKLKYLPFFLKWMSTFFSALFLTVYSLQQWICNSRTRLHCVNATLLSPQIHLQYHLRSHHSNSVRRSWEFWTKVLYPHQKVQALSETWMCLMLFEADFFSNLEAVAGTLLGMPSVVANSGLAAVSVRPVLWQRWTECHECYSKPPNFKAGAVCNAGILALLSWHNALFWSSNLARLSVRAYPLLICFLETFENICNEASDDKSVHLEVSMNYKSDLDCGWVVLPVRASIGSLHLRFWSTLNERGCSFWGLSGSAWCEVHQWRSRIGMDLFTTLKWLADWYRRLGACQMDPKVWAI